MTQCSNFKIPSKVYLQYFVSWKPSASMKESFLKIKNEKHGKNPPQLSFQTNLAWASEVPGQQPWITGWYHWFSWWLSKNHESCRRFHNYLYLPCENEASISRRTQLLEGFQTRTWHELANQHQGFGWSNQRVLPQHPSSRDCWRSLTKYPKVGACEVSGYSSVKNAPEHTFLVASYSHGRVLDRHYAIVTRDDHWQLL